MLEKKTGRVDPAELTQGRVDSGAELVQGRVDPLPFRHTNLNRRGHNHDCLQKLEFPATVNFYLFWKIGRYRRSIKVSYSDILICLFKIHFYFQDLD